MARVVQTEKGERCQVAHVCLCPPPGDVLRRTRQDDKKTEKETRRRLSLSLLLAVFFYQMLVVAEGRAFSLRESLHRKIFFSAEM